MRIVGAGRETRPYGFTDEARVGSDSKKPGASQTPGFSVSLTLLSLLMSVGARHRLAPTPEGGSPGWLCLLPSALSLFGAATPTSRLPELLRERLREP